MSNRVKGRVAWIFEDNFDVDLIVGVKNITTTHINRLLAAVMQCYDKDFKEVVTKGDFLVGGSNFGYGHPHPQPMMAMRRLGINTVITESFAFPFYRSELASGMTLVTCPHVSKRVSRWDELELDIENGILRNLTAGKSFTIDPMPPIVIDIIHAGGIVNYLRRKWINPTPYPDIPVPQEILP